MNINSLFIWDNVFFILLYFIKVSLCEDDLDGHITFYVSHSLEPSSVNPVFEQRGIIAYHSNKNEAVYSEDVPWTAAKIEKLKKLASTNDIYRIKISSKSGADDDSVFSFTKACAIYESGLTDSLTLTMDQSGAPVGIAISGIPPYCIGETVSDSKLLNFNTSIHMVTLSNGPAPDTLTYIQRLEREKAEKARGEQGDNRSFFSKYWMYIVPFVIFLFISGASSPDQQGGR